MSINGVCRLPLVAVILSGGAGTRLWPISRELFPKPYINLDDNQSLIQKAYLRANQIPGLSEIITVTNRELLTITRQQYNQVLQGTLRHTVLLEPSGKNSMASITFAALQAKYHYPSGSHLVILPGDHLINNTDGFNQAVSQAVCLSETGKLVTFGIQPTSAKTSYGYIKHSGNVVDQFVEKPDAERAQLFVEAGDYLWNSGMFCMQPDTLLRELEIHNSLIYQQCDQIFKQAITRDEGINFRRVDLSSPEFESLENISIDYALMEKSNNVAVVLSSFDWEDLGSWIEFSACFAKDINGNHVNAPVVLDDVKDCVIYSKERLIAGIGLKDLVVVDTNDALLVAHKNNTQQVKNIVTQLKAQNHPTHKTFGAELRPWGSFETIHEGPGFKVKTIEINPESSLSLQSHKHRDEHWVIVQGSAWVTNGNNYVYLDTGKSIYIPAGNLHRIENKSSKKLMLIEVQLGSYLGEDDIVRYHDQYGRVSQDQQVDVVTT